MLLVQIALLYTQIGYELCFVHLVPGIAQLTYVDVLSKESFVNGFKVLLLNLQNWLLIWLVISFRVKLFKLVLLAFVVCFDFRENNIFNALLVYFYVFRGPSYLLRVNCIWFNSLIDVGLLPLYYSPYCLFWIGISSHCSLVGKICFLKSWLWF